MSFLYPFLNFLQPGVLWPGLFDYRPMLVVSALGLAIGLFRLRHSTTRPAFSHPTFRWLTVFIVAQALSVYQGGGMALIEEATYWGTYLLFVVVSLLLLSNADALRRYVWGMIAGGMFVAGYGIYAVRTGIGWGVTGRAGAYGMYENHNDYSFIVLQIIPFIYTYYRVESTWFRRVFLAVSLVVCVVGIFMSMSRGAVIILVLEAALIVMFAMEGRRRLLLLPVIAAIGAGAVAYQFQQRAENQGDAYTAEDAQSSRVELVRAGIVMFKEHPMLGVGSRRFGELARNYYELSYDQIGKNSHNTFVEILSTSGLIGFLPFAFMAYFLLRDLRRQGNGGRGGAILNATVTATLISYVSMLCRSYFDAKTHDWSFYTLIAIGLCCLALGRQVGVSANSTRGTFQH